MIGRMNTSIARTNSHIVDAIAMLGGASAVARALGLTPWAVSKWRTKIPPERVLWIAQRTGWRKSPHQLCPELYPNETDGIPKSEPAATQAGEAAS